MTNQEDLDFLLRIRGILEEHGHGTGKLVDCYDGSDYTWKGPVCPLGAIAIDAGKLKETSERYMTIEAESERFVNLLGLSYEDIGEKLRSPSASVTLQKLMRIDYHHNVIWWVNDRNKEVITTKLNAAIERMQAEVRSEERELVAV